MRRRASSAGPLKKDDDRRKTRGQADTHVIRRRIDDHVQHGASALGSTCWQPAPNSRTLPKENSRSARSCCFTTVMLLLPAK
jgi:hypothetical protein